MAKNEANEAAMTETLAGGEASFADLEKEIASAVEKVSVPGEEPEGDEAETAETPPVAEAVAEGDEEPAEEEPADEAEGSQGRDDQGKFTKRAPLSDALLERAVKCGIPMSEARQYPTESLLSATCARHEGVQKTSGAETKSGDVKKDGEAGPVDLTSAIPDLSPDVYDPSFIKAWAAMKGALVAKDQEIAELRGKGSKDFLATQLEGVKEFTKGDQTKESAVRAKFDMLKAGYKATKSDVSDVTVFAEAAQLVLGGDMKAAAKQNKVDKAAARSTQRISRAAGNRIESKSDPIQQTGDEIHKKFFVS